MIHPNSYSDLINTLLFPSLFLISDDRQTINIKVIQTTPWLLIGTPILILTASPSALIFSNLFVNLYYDFKTHCALQCFLKSDVFKLVLKNQQSQIKPGLQFSLLDFSLVASNIDFVAFDGSSLYLNFLHLDEYFRKIYQSFVCILYKCVKSLLAPNWFGKSIISVS